MSKLIHYHRFNYLKCTTRTHFRQYLSLSLSLRLSTPLSVSHTCVCITFYRFGEKWAIATRSIRSVTPLPEWIPTKEKSRRVSTQTEFLIENCIAARHSNRFGFDEELLNSNKFSLDGPEWLTKTKRVYFIVVNNHRLHPLQYSGKLKPD